MCKLDTCLQLCTGMCMVASSRVQHDANFFSNLHHFPLLREEATSVLAGFHSDPLSWLSWKFEELIFVEGGKPENPKKNPQSKA